MLSRNFPIDVLRIVMFLILIPICTMIKTCFPKRKKSFPILCLWIDLGGWGQDWKWYWDGGSLSERRTETQVRAPKDLRNTKLNHDI